MHPRQQLMLPRWLFGEYPLLAYQQLSIICHTKLSLHVRPVRIVTSSAATKSVKTASTESSPAITFMISELGLVYFLGRTELRKAVIVFYFLVSLVPSQGISTTHIESVCICGSASFDASYCSRKQLPCLDLYPKSDLSYPSLYHSFVPGDVADRRGSSRR